MAEAGGEGVGGDVGSRPLATSSMARSETKKNASKDAGQALSDFVYRESDACLATSPMWMSQESCRPLREIGATDRLW